MNLYTSAPSGIMNNETLRKAQQNTTYELTAFDQGNAAGYGVYESPIFKNFFRGKMPPDPPI